jgi:subtilisin family serine protease
MRLALACAILAVGLAPAFTAEAATAAPSGELALATDIVVKVNSGYTIDQVMGMFPVAVDRAMLASRGIYLMRPTDRSVANDPHKAADLASHIRGAKTLVAYAELDQSIQLSDAQFHGWPYGEPTDPSDDPSTYTDQPMVSALQLDAAHNVAQGAGITIAVLDTGADPDQPALAGHLGAGWNYVDDNADTDDIAAGLDEDGDGLADSAYGHGTFVSGVAALVAPQATVLPYRVLDSDGYGSLYEVAQAVLDAAAQGADVINLSFGTAQAITSHVLSDAITAAQHAGAIVVAAAGNDGDNQPHFPAAMAGVLSTSALATDGTALTSFSDWGSWADVAAPGQDVVGPLPGGAYAHWAGTSMAAPVVSGQAALLFSLRAGVPVDKVMQAITSSTHPLLHNPVHFGSVSPSASLTWLAAHH